MHCVLALLFTLQPATVVAVLDNHEVLVAVRMGDVTFTAEFSRRELKRETFIEGDHVLAEVRNGKMRVRAEMERPSQVECFANSGFSCIRFLERRQSPKTVFK
jgi:hypothetical protein